MTAHYVRRGLVFPPGSRGAVQPQPRCRLNHGISLSHLVQIDVQGGGFSRATIAEKSHRRLIGKCTGGGGYGAVGAALFPPGSRGNRALPPASVGGGA